MTTTMMMTVPNKGKATTQAETIENNANQRGNNPDPTNAAYMIPGSLLSQDES